MQAIAFNEFMSGSYKEKKENLFPKTEKRKVLKIMKRVGTSIVIPLFMAKPAFAASPSTEAIPVGAGEWMGEQTISALAHILDPILDVLVALSFPVASVIIVGSCFYFMFDKADRAWSQITRAGLGYVLIQVSPLILNVLKEIGNAI